MWTADNHRIELPQIWDHAAPARSGTVRRPPGFRCSAKGCGADYVCMPAPVHNPDGSESLWCYTKPSAALRRAARRARAFPAAAFLGAAGQHPVHPLDSWTRPCYAARQYRPRFFYIYVPHLEYAAQKLGPHSAGRTRAPSTELDAALGRLIEALTDAYGRGRRAWLAASEYVITAVNHVSYPNRVLRQAGHLQVRDEARPGTARLRAQRAPGPWSITSSRTCSCASRTST